MIRYFGRIIQTDGETVKYVTPKPLSQGDISLFIASQTTLILPGERIVVDTFAIVDTYAFKGQRLADGGLTLQDVGGIWQQDNDDTFWRLDGVSPNAWTQVFPIPPALGLGGGGGELPENTVTSNGVPVTSGGESVTP